MWNKMVELFFRLEKKYNLFSLKYNDFSIWPFLRLEVFRMIASAKGKYEYSPVFERQVPVGNNVFFDGKSVNCEQCDLLLITNRHRLVEVNNEMVCPVTYMFQDMAHKIHTLYHSYQNANSIRDDYINCFCENPYGSKAEPLFSTHPDIYALNLLETVCREFVSESDLVVLMLRVKMMIAYVAYMSRLVHLYDCVIKSLHPKAIFVSSAYSIANMFFIGVAKKNRIPTVELQHGLIGEAHVAYNSLCENIPQIYYPNYLFVYGDFDKNIPKHIIPRKNVIVVGNKLLETFCENDSVKKNGVVVVGNISNNDVLVNIAVDIKKACPNIKVTYRVHAEESNNLNAIIFLEQCGVQVSNDVRVSVYRLLLEHKWVVGTVSTVLLEALRFNTNVVVLDVPSLTSQYNLAQRKLVMMKKSVLIDSIKNDISMKNNMELPYIFYARYNAKRVQTVIKNIIGKEFI